MSQELKREYSLRDLVLFHITAIITLRWISFAAARGTTSLGLWVLSFFVFLLPIAFVVIDFSRKMPVEGGIYQWTKNTLGPFHGYICAWCYVVNNLFYFPALLVSVAGYAAFTYFVKDPAIQNDTTYVKLFSLGALWAVLFLNLIGVRIGKWVQNIGGLSIWIPGTLVIILGIIHYFQSGSATHFSSANYFPSFSSFDTWTAWASICFAFTGIELASTMSEEVKDPVRNIPRSIYLAGICVTGIYILGTISILVTIGSANTNLVTGIIQSISAVLSSMGLKNISPLVALLLTIGGLGTLGAWLAGAARLPYTVGVDRYLPAVFGRLHPRWGTPYVSLLTLGIISSGIIWMSFAGSSVKTAYSILNSATLILYFIPFLYLFSSHIAMNWRTEKRLIGFVLAFAGTVSTVIAIILSLIPPADSTEPQLYILEVGGGSAVMVLISVVL